jgi:gluconate:H+ symporter, GntP family
MSEPRLPAELLTGPFLVVALLVGIGFIVVATTRWKLHPFLALLATAYGLGIAGGLTPTATVNALAGGVGQTVGHIGIVIAFGSVIGMVLEKSGCAVVMANAIVRMIGEGRSVLAMSCTGALVSIPVFCDSGYVILSSLNRSLARQTGQSLATFAVALGMGLYATHCLVPPTPGPLATAGQLRADIGSVILLGFVVSVPIIATTYLYAQFIGRRIHIDPAPPGSVGPERDGPLVTGTRSSAVAAFSPIFLPVVLIALDSVAALPGQPIGNGFARQIIGVFGQPEIALGFGVLLTWFITRHSGREAFGEWCGEGLREAGMVILIVAAGGAMGAVLRETPMASMVGNTLSGLELGRFHILVPFVIAAALKTAIGSSTMAMITTASLISHLLPSLGLASGFGPALATLAIASGAMVVSHVNDAYFWVVTQMSDMTVTQGYRLMTMASAIAGFTGIITVLGLSLFLL